MVRSSETDPRRSLFFLATARPAPSRPPVDLMEEQEDDPCRVLRKAQRALQQINSPSTSYPALVTAFAQSLAILQTFGTADTMMEVMEGAFVPELEDTRLLVQRIRDLCHESGEEERDNSCMLNC